MSLLGQLKATLRRPHQRFVWSRSLRRVLRLPNKADLSEWRLADLEYGWGNSEWSATVEFQHAALTAARATRGPILECGSGLSTVLLGIAAQKAGIRVWTLEHDAMWAARIESSLRRLGISSVQMCVAPLRSYGEFFWYALPPDGLPSDFSLVICDGPPGETIGGRYGLLPVLGDHLAPSCRILLDDAGRAGEQDILLKWRQEAGWDAGPLRGTTKQFAMITVPPREGS
jgi:hypothetical protein